MHHSGADRPQAETGEDRSPALGKGGESIKPFRVETTIREVIAGRRTDRACASILVAALRDYPNSRSDSAIALLVLLGDEGAGIVLQELESSRLSDDQKVDVLGATSPLISTLGPTTRGRASNSALRILEGDCTSELHSAALSLLAHVDSRLILRQFRLLRRDAQEWGIAKTKSVFSRLDFPSRLDRSLQEFTAESVEELEKETATDYFKFVLMNEFLPSCWKREGGVRGTVKGLSKLQSEVKTRIVLSLLELCRVSVYCELAGLVSKDLELRAEVLRYAADRRGDLSGEDGSLLKAAQEVDGDDDALEYLFQLAAIVEDLELIGSMFGRRKFEAFLRSRRFDVRLRALAILESAPDTWIHVTLDALAEVQAKDPDEVLRTRARRILGRVE